MHAPLKSVFQCLFFFTSLSVSPCNLRKLVNLTFVTTILSAELTRNVNIMFSFAATDALGMHKLLNLCFLWHSFIFNSSHFEFSCFAVFIVCNIKDTILLQVFKYISLCYYTAYTADVVRMVQTGRHLFFLIQGHSFNLLPLWKCHTGNERTAPWSTSPLSTSLSFCAFLNCLTSLSSSLLTHSVMWPVLHYKDEEEDEEGEMMSDHMKDSEVWCSPFAEARCVFSCFKAF